MPQIRKYEVDAIVDGICTQILVNSSSIIEKLKKTDEYAELNKRNSEINLLKEEYKALSNKIDSLSSKRSEELAHFNLNVIKNEAFKATIPYSYNSAEDKIKIETDVSAYSNAREEVFNRLTIALLPSDSMENIQEIMSTIVDEFLNV
tara:strand:+ start:799 stop:1242 length:444 start_codon:yes stop_codon:yes gene_type:complete